MIYGKLINKKLYTCKSENYQAMIDSGYLPVEYINTDILLGELESINKLIIIQDNQIKVILTKKIDNNKVKSKIEKIKLELTSTDYKIIKGYEYSLVGIPIEYDIQNLHFIRLQKRNEINKLELMLTLSSL